MNTTRSRQPESSLVNEQLVEQKLARFAKLKRLTTRRAPRSPSKRDLDRTFDRLAELIPATGDIGYVEFQLRSGRSTPTWTLILSEAGAQVSSAKATKPRLRIIVGQDDWWQVAQGIVSPIALFLRGRMRFVGDCGIAQRAFVQLAGPGVAKL